MPFMFDVKSALFAALQAGTPAGTQVTYAETGKADRRNQIFLGNATDDDNEVAGMRKGPRKPTNVSGTIEVHAVVVTPGKPIDAERAVYGLRDLIADACDSIDRASVAGLQDIRPESSSVDTAETTDGAYSALTVRVHVRGRIT
jgi:hypothetical protein